jgi:ParB family chromosome partitioning protein
MRSALGKGLDALLSGSPEQASASPSATLEKPSASELPIDRIRPNPKQPRRTFSESALKELSDSIVQRGVLQPILVSALPDGNYELIAGERRWRAAQRAGLTHIPAVVKNAPELERFQIALIENIQREDLSPIEQAQGYMRLVNEFHMTQESIASAMGKDRAVVANTLRLLGLPEEMQTALSEGKISASHGRSLAALEDPVSRLTLFKRIIEENLSVRAVEQAVREHKKVAVRGHVRNTSGPAKSPEVKSLEEELQRALSRKVELHTSAGDSKKGFLKLEFYSLDDLDRLVRQLQRASHLS